jgi:hypothetical protein
MTDYKPPPIKPPRELDEDTASATRAAAVLPGQDITPCRALWVGAQGDLIVTMAGNDSPVTFANAIGIMPICVKRIEPATTAGAIIALY